MYPRGIESLTKKNRGTEFRKCNRSDLRWLVREQGGGKKNYARRARSLMLGDGGIDGVTEVIPFKNKTGSETRDI
jgi:hypothetical protein